MVESDPTLPLVLCHSQDLGCGKGVRRQLCVAPAGPFRQLTPAPFATPIPKLNCDKALVHHRYLTTWHGTVPPQGIAPAYCPSVLAPGVAEPNAGCLIRIIPDSLTP